MRNKTIQRVVAVLVLAVIGVGVAIFALSEQFQSDPIPLSAANDGLAFNGNRDGTWDLFYLDSDETLINLTNGAEGEQDYFASWSLNGEAINFLSNRSGEMGPAQVKPDDLTAGVRTLNPVQALVQMVSEGLTDWDPQWSPQASSMIYASLANGLAVNLDLYVLAGDAPERLTEDGPAGPNDWFVAWSPDGTRFAYNSNRAGDENLYLRVLGEDAITQLTEAAADDIHAAWSMDGETILFVSERERRLIDGDLDLWLMDADGGNIRPFGDDDTFTGDPVYSANGEQIAYMSNEDGRWGIYIMSADGDDARRVTPDDADYLFPAWRPIPE